jgi:hypothetical protein
LLYGAPWARKRAQASAQLPENEEPVHADTR